MRLWIRMLLVLATVALVPLLLAGALAVGAAREAAAVRPEEQMSREATTLATFVGSWMDSQASVLAGWQRVWDLRGKSEDYQLGLARAAYKAMDEAVTVALVDARGSAVVPPQYLGPGLAAGGREPGSDARAQALLKHQPTRLDSTGLGIGVPYLPPGAEIPSVAIAAGGGDSELRLVAEISLATLARVLSERGDVATVLVDGKGQPVLGGGHPYLQDVPLDRLLDLGLDLTFSSEEAQAPYQGAVWGVPGTDWKIVVLAPPSAAAEAAARIRTEMVRVAVLAVVLVVLVGVAIDRTVARSVVELAGHAEAVRKGELEVRNRVDRADEIGDLGLALNEMTTRIERDDAELRAFHAELQARVEARTAELRAAQAQLVRAGQVAAVGEVSAGLAHELNNPLATILGQAQVLLADLRRDPEAGLRAIEAQAERCRGLVDTMLRLGGDRPQAAVDVVELPAVLSAALADVGACFEARGVELVPPEEPPEAPVRIEPAVLRRLLAQLLEALAAGLPAGASLTVSVEDGERPEVHLRPDRLVADDAVVDDWRAAGLKSWSVRGLVALAGGEVLPGDAGDPTWRVRFPGAA